MKLRLTITPKVTLTFVLFALVLLLSVSLLAFYNGQRALQEAAIADLESTALEKAAALESWIHDQQLNLDIIIAAPSLNNDLFAAVSRPVSPQTRARFVDALRVWVGKGSIQEIALIDPDSGQVILSTDPDEEGLYKEDRSYFVNGKQAAYVQNVTYSIKRGESEMFISAPWRAADGKVSGVLAARLSLDQMNTILNRRSGVRQSEESFLVNTSNLFVTQPRFISDAVLRRGNYSAPVKNCLRQEDGSILSDDYRGVAVIEVYRWLPERQMCLIVKIDQAEAFQAARAFGMTLLLIGLVMLAVSLGIAFTLARSITRPIVQLQDAVIRYGQGDHDLRLPKFSNDEIGLLACEFVGMTDSLTEKDKQLRAYAQDLEKRVEERTQELARSNSDLEQFAYVASHDLQEPLRMVTSYMQLLSQRYSGKLDLDADEFIRFAYDGATRMQGLLHDLLAYSRVGTRGKKPEATSAAEVVGQVLIDLQVAVEESGALITCDELPVVMADSTQMQQLFQNLIGNAIKFHSDELPRVHISAKQVSGGWVVGSLGGSTPPQLPNHQTTQQPRTEWLFSIQDNGIGLDPQFAERIFVIFQRLHTRAEHPGSGVGLAICKKIVERHGGRIWVESQPGKGATFYFTLPEAKG